MKAEMWWWWTASSANFFHFQRFTLFSSLERETVKKGNHISHWFHWQLPAQVCIFKPVDKSKECWFSSLNQSDEARRSVMNAELALCDVGFKSSNCGVEVGKVRERAQCVFLRMEKEFSGTLVCERIVRQHPNLECFGRKWVFVQWKGHATKQCFVQWNQRTQTEHWCRALFPNMNTLGQSWLETFSWCFMAKGHIWEQKQVTKHLW